MKQAKEAVDKEYKKHVQCVEKPSTESGEAQVEREALVSFVGGLPLPPRLEEQNPTPSTAPSFAEAWEQWTLLSKTMKFKEMFEKELAHIANEEDLDPIQVPNTFLFVSCL